MYSVVIPAGSGSNLRQSVTCLYDKHDWLTPGNVIIVYDGERVMDEAGGLPGVWIKGSEPFNLSKNVNKGFVAADQNDVIIMADDILVETKNAFDNFKYNGETIVSAAIMGVAPNPMQRVGNHRKGFVTVDAFDNFKYISFSCVYIPRKVINRVGGMDERFGKPGMYGFDDYDYCWRACKEGISVMVNHDVIVNHGKLPSCFRSRADFRSMYERGKAEWRLARIERGRQAQIERQRAKGQIQ